MDHVKRSINVTLLQPDWAPVGLPSISKPQWFSDQNVKTFGERLDTIKHALEVRAAKRKEEAREARERDEIDLSPSENGRLKAAISQLALVKAVKVSVTQPNKKVLNGVYLQRAVDSRHEGWPRFESPDGMHLFRYIRENRWFLRDTFDPDSGMSQVRILQSIRTVTRFNSI